MEICCPACDSANIKKNGHIHTGKQNHQCNKCGRQFVRNSTQKRISDKGVIPEKQHRVASKEGHSVLGNGANKFQS